MRITRKMINELELMKAIPEEGPSPGFIIAPYMEYPPPDKKMRYVMQWHIRGRSVHTDWRMEVNDHLIGWTVLSPGGIKKPVYSVKEAKEILEKTKIEFNSKNRNKGFRAETKARQPKCISASSYLVTQEGLKHPSEINIGEQILTLEGFQPVTQIDTIKDNEIVRIKAAYSLPLEVNGEHPFLVLDLKERRPEAQLSKRARKEKYQVPLKWVKARDLRTSDFLILPKEIPVNGKGIEDPSLARILGYYLGDGSKWNKNGIRLPFFKSTRKEELVSRYFNLLSKYGKPCKWTEAGGKTVLALTNPMIRNLVDTPRKTFKLEWLNSPPEVLKQFVEGLVDADGWRDKSGYHFVNTNSQLIISLQLLLLRLGTLASIRERKRNWKTKHSIYELSWTMKKHQFKDLGKFLAIPIKQIEKRQEELELWNIVTPSHTLITPFFVSHNTWLTVEGVVQPGQVGATKEYPGVFIIVDKGYVYFGCQKPYFHEYFLKSTKEDGPFSSKDWTRVVVRAVNVQVIDQETKKPRPGTELMWRVMVPGDQTPYALSRGMKKGWVPPKGYIPIPPEWRKGEEYEKWYKWVQEAWKGKVSKEEEPEKESQDLATPRFTVHYMTYMGQIVVRGIPHQKWFLRIKEGNKVRSWIADLDFTRFSPVALQYEGEVESKWFDYEGDIPPNTKYNPTKTLTAKMRIIDSGTCTLKKETVDGAERILATFKGKLMQGQYLIAQEEKDTPVYTIEKLPEELKESTFVLQLHEIETPEGLKKHWDIRISDGFEFNLYADPRTLTKEGDSTKAVWKVCREIEKWMAIDKPKTKMMVGDLVTYVTPLDKGKVNLIEISPPHFISMIFHGEELQGYFVYVDREERGGVFERAKLPHALARTGNPAKGDYFEPFNVIKKEGWDYFWLEIYDIREFTRCVEDPTKYIPELKHAPPEVLDVLVCLYPRPGTVHGARVSRVRFSDKWTVKQASDWIKSNKLHTWQGELIREQRKATEDEMLMKIIEEELKRREKSPEEKQLELELKKKKLELIEKWLKAQEEEQQ